MSTETTEILALTQIEALTKVVAQLEKRVAELQEEVENQDPRGLFWQRIDLSDDMWRQRISMLEARIDRLIGDQKERRKWWRRFPASLRRALDGDWSPPR